MYQGKGGKVHVCLSVELRNMGNLRADMRALRASIPNSRLQHLNPTLHTLLVHVIPLHLIVRNGLFFAFAYRVSWTADSFFVA